MWLLPVFWSFCAYGAATAPSLPFLLGAFLLTYLYIELYGAVLHVNLDNPNFLVRVFFWGVSISRWAEGDSKGGGERGRITLFPRLIHPHPTPTHTHTHQQTLPVLWEPCLEFQWHHFVPHEICVRSYPQICADMCVHTFYMYIYTHAKQR